MYDMYGFTEIPRYLSEISMVLSDLPSNRFNVWWWLDVLEWWFNLPPLIGIGLFGLVSLAIMLSIYLPLYLYTKIAPYIGDHTDYSYNPDKEQAPEFWQYPFMSKAEQKMWDDRCGAEYIAGVEAGKAAYKADCERSTHHHHHHRHHRHHRDDPYEDGFEHGYDWS